LEPTSAPSSRIAEPTSASSSQIAAASKPTSTQLSQDAAASLSTSTPSSQAIAAVEPTTSSQVAVASSTSTPSSQVVAASLSTSTPSSQAIAAAEPTTSSQVAVASSSTSPPSSQVAAASESTPASQVTSSGSSSTSISSAAAVLTTSQTPTSAISSPGTTNLQSTITNTSSSASSQPEVGAQPSGGQVSAIAFPPNKAVDKQNDNPSISDATSSVANNNAAGSADASSGNNTSANTNAVAKSNTEAKNNVAENTNATASTDTVASTTVAINTNAATNNIEAANTNPAVNTDVAANTVAAANTNVAVNTSVAGSDTTSTTTSVAANDKKASASATRNISTATSTSDTTNAKAADTSSPSSQSTSSLVTDSSSVFATATKVSNVENRPAGGQVSAIAFPPSNGNIGNGNTASADTSNGDTNAGTGTAGARNGNINTGDKASTSTSSTSVASNTEVSASAGTSAGKAGETSNKSNDKSSTIENTVNQPPPGIQSTAGGQNKDAGFATTSSATVNSVPPSLGSSFPPANSAPPPSLGSSFPPAKPGSAEATTTTNAGQSAQQTTDKTNAQSTQAAATGTATEKSQQSQSDTSNQKSEPPKAQSTEASSTSRIIGSAFGPPATTSTAESAKGQNNQDQNGKNKNENNADRGNPAEGGKETNLSGPTENNKADASDVPGSSEDANNAKPGDIIVDSKDSRQTNAANPASGVSAKVSQDAGANKPKPSSSSAPNPGSAVSDAPRPSISGLGKDFGGSRLSNSAQPTDEGIGDAGKISAGIGTATSLMTSVIASGKPTSTITGGGTPSVSTTKESPGGFKAIAEAFSNPVTRSKSIGITVAVVIVFVLIVALIAFLVWYFRRGRKQLQADNSESSSPADGEKGEMNISGPISQRTQEEIANYDPSAELMADSGGLDYGPSQPSQLDDALVNRASRLSTSRKSFLDIYGEANTPYPQDVVDGSGRPITQQFLMPDADKFQLNGLGPISPFNPKVPGTDSGASHQRNISTASRLSNLPADANPDQPAPFRDKDGLSPTDPVLLSSQFNPGTQPVTEDPFSDDNVAPLVPLATRKMSTMKSQKPRRTMGRQRADSWMTVNSVATAKPGPPPTAGGAGLSRKNPRTDYTSVYMRNPFIDPPEGGGGGAAPPMPGIPKRLQHQQPKHQQTESVTLMLSPNTLNPAPQYSHQLPASQQQSRPLSGPGDTEFMYGGVLDDYPPRPPSTQVGVAPLKARAYEESRGYGAARRSNPFDLEVNDGAGGAGAEFRDDNTVKSVRSWLSGVAEAEKSRMEKENVI
jgi:hypothetical protein